MLRRSSQNCGSTAWGWRKVRAWAVCLHGTKTGEGVRLSLSHALATRCACAHYLTHLTLASRSPAAAAMVDFSAAIDEETLARLGVEKGSRR